MLEDPLLPWIIVLVLLIVLHACFAAAAAAIESLSEAKLRKQTEEGDTRAQRLLELFRKPERIALAVQTGMTVVGFLTATLAAYVFSGYVAAWLAEDCGLSAGARVIAVILVTLVTACVLLVLGVLVPRRAVRKDAEETAYAACVMGYAISVIFRPLSWVLTKCANGILRLMRIDPEHTGEEVSEDEILMMVDIGEETGSIEANEKEMIENIFEFNNNTAEDVMIHRTDMVMIWIDDPAEEILRIIEESGLSRFPVYNEDADDIVGTLNTRDYLFNTHRKEPKTFRELLRPAYFVPESVRTDVLFRDMQSKKVHMAIVVDEYGGTSGLVTMEDLLEEIVGNIYDEFDPQDEQEIVRMEDNLWKVAGVAELEHLAEELDVELPEDEEFDTLGGLVYSQLSVIPEDGSTVEVEACGLHIKVIEFSDRRVEWALVSKVIREEEPDEEEK